jgi:tetratricopeptide (TPR) repeat protein
MVHLAAEEALSHLLLRQTAPLLDAAQLAEAEEVFQRTAWLRQYRRFDPEKALAQYWSSLPGVSGAGVLRREDFQASPVAGELQYSEYLHSVSHSHRVTSSITSQLKLLDDGFASSQYSRYIQPHLGHLAGGTLSEGDRAMCQYGLASVASATAPDSALSLYQSVLGEQRRVLGARHPAVARTLTDLAGLQFAREDVAGARSLLESALAIYQALPPGAVSSEVRVDQGLALASLAVVASCQGEKGWSRDLLEQALSLYQTVPESGEVSLYQRRLVAATLTDLSHAYLTLGQTVLAQKYVELALLATPSVYPEGSGETVRALTVAGAVYALLGDKRESQRVGQEASKEKTKLEKQQLVFL